MSPINWRRFSDAARESGTPVRQPPPNWSKQLGDLRQARKCSTPDLEPEGQFPNHSTTFYKNRAYPRTCPVRKITTTRPVKTVITASSTLPLFRSDSSARNPKGFLTLSQQYLRGAGQS